MQKSTKELLIDSTLTINNFKFNISKASSLKANAMEVIKELTDSYNRLNVFTNRSFYPNTAKFQFVLVIDENKISASEKKQLLRIMKELHKDILENKPDLI